jgi:colanic acid/amylovoran biosynthesis glycosyltransferase
MRIAFIVSAFPTLSETFILNQITGLIDRGHEVDIFVRCRGRDSQVHEDVFKYGLLRRTFYKPSIPDNKFKRLLKGLYLFVFNFHRSPKLLIRSLNLFKYGKKAANLYMLFDVIPFLGRRPYDIIHCHFGPSGLLGVQMRDLGAIEGKLVTTFHGHDMSAYVRNQGNEVYNILFERGELFLPISERWKSRLIELGCDKNKISVHHMGIDCGKLSFSLTESGDDKQIRILTIARLVEKKGVEYGIRAVATLSKRYKNVGYNIVGDGPLQNCCDRLITDLKMGDIIHLLGWKSQEQVYSLIASSHIFLCPSLTSVNGDQEGIPVALMEAMAAGLPIISTWHSGIPELVQDGVSGFLVPERDIDALAERLTYLIDHPEVWPKMGRAGRIHVEANYDIKKLNDRLVQIYENLLRKNGHKSNKEAIIT